MMGMPETLYVFPCIAILCKVCWLCNACITHGATKPPQVLDVAKMAVHPSPNTACMLR